MRREEWPNIATFPDRETDLAFNFLLGEALEAGEFSDDVSRIMSDFRACTKREFNILDASRLAFILQNLEGDNNIVKFTYEDYLAVNDFSISPEMLKAVLEEKAYRRKWYSL